MMTLWCLIASLRMAFGTEPNAYERSTGPASNFSLYPPDDAVRVPGEPPLDGGLFSPLEALALLQTLASIFPKKHTPLLDGGL